MPGKSSNTANLSRTKPNAKRPELCEAPPARRQGDVALDLTALK